MSAIGFTMSLRAGDDGSLHADISPSDDQGQFHMRHALLVLRVWRESSKIVRCAIHHPTSRTTAYIQGNEQIDALLQALRLELRP